VARFDRSTTLLRNGGISIQPGTTTVRAATAAATESCHRKRCYFQNKIIQNDRRTINETNRSRRLRNIDPLVFARMIEATQRPTDYKKNYQIRLVGSLHQECIGIKQSAKALAFDHTTKQPCWNHRFCVRRRKSDSKPLNSNTRHVTHTFFVTGNDFLALNRQNISNSVCDPRPPLCGKLETQLLVCVR